MTPVLLALALVACLVAAVGFKRMSRDLDRYRLALHAVRCALLDADPLASRDFGDLPVESTADRLYELLADWRVERDAHAQEIRSAVEALEQMRKRQPVDPDTARWIAERARLLKAMYRLEEHLARCRDEHGGNSCADRPRPRPITGQPTPTQIGAPA